MATKDEKESNKKTPDYKYLVIVESPAKSKTLTKILGKDFLVKSSVGHIRDLPAKGLGIDVKNNFDPTYEIMPGKQKVVEELNQYAKTAEHVYLASDPDREGEAIAWHLSQIIHSKKSNVSRITFNQITPDAVRNAVAHPRAINQSLVEAQQARRILDRLVGYKISPILWRKVGGRSAGRVQSVAVRLICEREEEIQKFKPEEYWSIAADVTRTSLPPSFQVNLVQVDSKRIVAPIKEHSEDKTIVIGSETEVNKIKDKINSAKIAVINIGSRPTSKKPQAPFKTSTLQRAASSALGFSVKRTMQVAQTLYEGVKLGTNEQVGLITYMRTDSLRIAQEAQDAAKEYILEKWGQDYYPESPNVYSKAKKQNEQDAHEAIRPTYIDKDPDSIKKYLSEEQYRLYKLIWQRFLTSQMTAAKIEIKTLEIASENKDLLFKASQSKKTFLGYTIVFGTEKEIHEDSEKEELESKFPQDIKIGDEIKVLEVLPSQHFTEGPPRYNEASLVKTLEELGIGRPSTYAPVIATIQDRKYAEKLPNSTALMPTKLGMQVNKLLVDHFGKYINVDFTSQMEHSLDEVADASHDWVEMLKEFYLGKDWAKKDLTPKRGKKKKTDEAEPATKKDEPVLDEGFIDIVKKASEEIEYVPISTDYDCPNCSAKMLLKSSRNGPFLGCSRYPDCKATVNLTKDGTPAPPDRPIAGEICPKCTKESLVIKYGRYGDYISCSTEDCKYTSPILKKVGVHCPREGCHGEIVEKKSRFGKVFFGCSAWSENKCDSVFWYPPINEHCPKCNKLMMYKNLKRGDKIACSDTKGCGFSREALDTETDLYKEKFFPAKTKEEKSVFSL